MKKFENDPHLIKFLGIARKVEPVLLGLVLLGFVGRVQQWPLPPAVFITATSGLILLYVLHGLALVTPIEESFERLAARLIHFSIACGLLAFLLQVMDRKGWMDLGMIAILGIMICFAVFVLKKKSITQYLSIFELSSLLLVMLYLGKVFYQMNA
jgi:hypothetical protein